MFALLKINMIPLKCCLNIGFEQNITHELISFRNQKQLFYVFSTLFVINDIKTNIIKKEATSSSGKSQDYKINNCNEVNRKDIN